MLAEVGVAILFSEAVPASSCSIRRVPPVTFHKDSSFQMKGVDAATASKRDAMPFRFAAADVTRVNFRDGERIPAAETLVEDGGCRISHTPSPMLPMKNHVGCPPLVW